MSAPLDALRQDARDALRGLRRAPGFSLIVVLTLALAVSTNTAIFSVVDQLLLRPLPYPDGDQVLRIYEFSNARDSRSDVNPGNWLDWQRQSRTLESLAAWDPAAATLTGVGEPQRLQSLLVSSEFFPLLRVQPLVGRVISPEDDRPNAPRVAVLSYALWQGRFNSDPGVVGRVIQLNENPVEVIGVMPAGFRFVPQHTDYWTAFRLDRNRAWRDTSGRFMSVVARMRPGVTLAQARTEMVGIARGLQTYRINQIGQGATVELVPLRDEMVGDLQAPLLAIYGAVVVLLAIACLNVASLLLARSLSRRRDIAVRAALGAVRRVIVRQLLVESIVLAIMSGLVGVLFARAILNALLVFAPDVLPITGLRLDPRLLFYAFGLSVLTGTLVGLMPALVTTRSGVASVLRSNNSTITHTPHLRQMLVVGQVAMTVVLLSGAGLLIRTVSALSTSDAGFNRRDLLTMEVALPAARYDARGTVEFFRQARERLRQLPGVESTAAAYSLPVTGAQLGKTGADVLGQPPVPPSDRQSAVVRVVTPDYFRTLGAVVLRGREFTEADQDPGSPLVFVVNQAFVSKFLNGQDPLTAAISVGMQAENPHARIVGVVGNVSEGTLWDTGQPTVFYNHRQIPTNAMVLLIRASASGGLARAAIDAIHQLDANLAVANVRTIEGVLGESIGRERLIALISTTIALSGLLLASLGLYGLLAFIVSERTKEIGLRIALGAGVGTLLRSVLGGGLRLVAVGAALGAVVALVALRSIGFLFFGVSPYDPWTYIAVLILLGIVATAATVIPARRAAHVDPAVALRAD